MKKLLTAVCLSLLFSIAVPRVVMATEPAYVSTSRVFEPFWQNTAVVSVTLRISGGSADMLDTVVCNAGTERITAVAVLERINANGTATQVATWRNITAQGRNLIWEQ